MLPHPGSQATKKTFSGSLRQLDPFFRALVNIYVRKIFGGFINGAYSAHTKRVNGRCITGQELLTFFQVYSAMFQTGCKTFPKAMTMLEATAEANTRNAVVLAIQQYKTEMTRCTTNNGFPVFLKEDDLKASHSKHLSESLTTFDSIATMGSVAAIASNRYILKCFIKILFE